MRNYLVEFIGTFFLVFTIGCTVLRGGLFAPLALGSILMVMTYAGYHVSGAHYNPAVSLAVWVRGRLSTGHLLGYIVVQVLAGAAAAMAAGFLMSRVGELPAFPRRRLPVTLQIEIVPALMAEVLFTFALCYVFLNVATARATSGNSFYGLAIGFTVLAGTYAVGSISGAALNPAVAVGNTLMGRTDVTVLWIYPVANFAGALLAGIVFRIINRDDTHPATAFSDP